MGNRSGQFDMAHAVTAHLGQGNLDTAFLTDNAFVLHALVLTAQAFVILDRAKDTRTEQTIPLRLEGPVVDRLRLLDFTKRPGADLLRAGNRDADLIETRRRILLSENLRHVAHMRSPKKAAMLGVNPGQVR